MASDPGAGGPPVDATEILTEVTGIAADPGTPADRAEALLAQLRRVVHFDAGWIALLSPSQDAHVPLARTGCDERVSAHLRERAPGWCSVWTGGSRRSRGWAATCCWPPTPRRWPPRVRWCAPARSTGRSCGRWGTGTHPARTCASPS